MSDEVQVKAGYAVEDVVALMSTLHEMMNLEDGELYALHKGLLRRVARQDEDSGLRRIKLMEEAYEAAQIAARRLRKYERGYRPDPALVVSAFVMHACAEMTPEDADTVALNYLQRLFHPALPGADQAATATDSPAAPNRPSPSTAHDTHALSRTAARLLSAATDRQSTVAVMQSAFNRDFQRGVEVRLGFDDLFSFLNKERPDLPQEGGRESVRLLGKTLAELITLTRGPLFRG